MSRNGIPYRARVAAAMNPVGPAPTMSTSTALPWANCCMSSVACAMIEKRDAAGVES